MAGAALDMTLDDLIKSNKKPAARGEDAALVLALHAASLTAPPIAPLRTPLPRSDLFADFDAPESAWGHDMFSAGGRASSIETGTKLYISNLDYGVSNEDIKLEYNMDKTLRKAKTTLRPNLVAQLAHRSEGSCFTFTLLKRKLFNVKLKELFAEEGDLKRYHIHYDRSGRSKSSHAVNALAAIKRYNVQLDGKPMKIELVGTNVSTSGAVLPPAGAFADTSVALRSGGQGRGGFGRPRGGGRGRGFGRGRGRGRAREEKVSAEDLDADLEKYHADAMQTN
ncbi:UNVERIFIED_CONTAM: THO complex subunitA [Sesamum calycinum]|uniref:THO complex subunitA n=1 Tax=Sesamum calycinum TaxID=2727403 RepID=A0AAW2SE65_9LAMI